MTVTDSDSRPARLGQQVDPAILERIARRALVHCVHMIWEANHRPDQQKGDPKVGGHPAACASSLHIGAALHLVARHPSDYYCAKPHLAPLDHCYHYLLRFFRDRKAGRWLDDDEMEGAMHRLRKFSQAGEPVFQSYHSDHDPDTWRTLPSGTVGIPPVCSAYLALAYDYATDHGFAIKGKKHFWSIIGDSEFREGSLMEALPDIAERELGNVTWIIDYNRQNLDGTRMPNERSLHGTDADRIERTARANGWDVIQVRHGRFREELFRRPGGEVFREILETRFSDYEYQGILFRRDPELFRAELRERTPTIDRFLREVDDEELQRAITDLGGHDVACMSEALLEARRNLKVPVMVVAHTIKGWGLRCAAAPGNHSTIPEEDEVLELLAAEGLSPTAPYDRVGNWQPDGPELRYLEDRGRWLREGNEASLERIEQNRRTVRERLARHWPLPQEVGVDTRMVPWAHTQWAWGQIAGRLVRVGVQDELAAAGRDPGRPLTPEEEAWAEAADFLLTMSPDVGTSTNINPVMDQKVYGPEPTENPEEEFDLRERGRPELAMHEDPWTRHIRFEIAEANCMSAAGAFGKMKEFTGVPYFPMMTVYDFFIKRALDQLYYNLYWGSSFLLVGTPSGCTLSPEGAQHSWKSDIQIPNLITWEPFFAKEMDWIIADAVRRHLEDDNEDRKGVLVRGVTRGIRQKEMLERLRRLPRFQGREGPVSDEEILRRTREDVLAGGYQLVDHSRQPDYTPGENVVAVLSMGAVTTEALAASDALAPEGLYLDVYVVTSPDLLLGRFARRDGYRHLREGLGLTGDLHLGAAGPEPLGPGDTLLLSARRVPLVSVCDGEEGLLDNAGSILGVPQIALAMRRFSKSGRPVDVYAWEEIDAANVQRAAREVLAQTAFGEVRLGRSAWERLAGRQMGDGRVVGDWRELLD